MTTEASKQKNGSSNKNVPSEKPAERELRRWQNRLMPVMIWLMIGMTIFFFVATFIQMAYIHWSMLRIPPVDLSPAIEDAQTNHNMTFNELIDSREREIAGRLEAYLVERRYHQASVLLMSGVWIRYLGFVTGMMLALVGASFILGRLQTPISTIEGRMEEISLQIRSASPGIILVVLGVVLMFATIINRDVYTVQDVPTYLSSPSQHSASVEQYPSTLCPIECYETPTPELLTQEATSFP